MNAAVREESTRTRKSGGNSRVTKSAGRKPERGAGGEETLLKMLKRGDQEAIRVIMQRYHDKLFSVANRICNNPADAEEILQDVYMIALNKVDRFEARSTISTWLYRITVNAALMKLRSQRSGKGTIPIEGYSAMLGEDDNILRCDEAVRPPDETLLRNELYEQIRASVEALPEIYQSVFYLRDVEGYSIKETSRMLHTTPAAIKSRLHRSRFFIKEKLDHYLSRN